MLRFLSCCFLSLSFFVRFRRNGKKVSLLSFNSCPSFQRSRPSVELSNFTVLLRRFTILLDRRDTIVIFIFLSLSLSLSLLFHFCTIESKLPACSSNDFTITAMQGQSSKLIVFFSTCSNFVHSHSWEYSAVTTAITPRRVNVER